MGQIDNETGVHPNQISQMKNQLLDAGAGLFRRNGEASQQSSAKREAELYEQIGRLKAVGQV